MDIRWVRRTVREVLAAVSVAGISVSSNLSSTISINLRVHTWAY